MTILDGFLFCTLAPKLYKDERHYIFSIYECVKLSETLFKSAHPFEVSTIIKRIK